MDVEYLDFESLGYMCDPLFLPTVVLERSGALLSAVRDVVVERPLPLSLVEVRTLKLS